MGCKVITIPLGDLVTMSSGGTPNKERKELWNGSIPWVSAKTLRGDCITNSDLYISELGLESSATKIAPKGSLLLLTRGSGLFKRIPLAIVGKPVAYNQDIKCISSKMSAISNRYLFYALKALEPSISGMLETTGIGAGKLSTGLLEQLSVPILEEGLRDRVVSFFDTLTSKIAVNERINGYLFDLAATQFAELVIQESTEVKLGEIVELEDSKRIPLNSRDRAKRQGPYPYYGAASVMDHVDDYLFDGIRVLLGEDGTVITDDGHPVLQYVWGKYWVNNHAHVLKASGPYSLESIYIALAAASASELVTGAVQPKINQKNLRNLTLDMPSPGSLAYLETVFASYRASVEESRRLTELRDTLLPKLMSGEIDVSEIEVPTLPNSHLCESS